MDIYYLLTISVVLKIFIPENDTISFIQNYIIGITCSILVVIITTFLQYKSEYERVMSEFTSILRQLILNLLVALSYQEKDVDEWLFKEIIDKIKAAAKPTAQFFTKCRITHRIGQ